MTKRILLLDDDRRFRAVAALAASELGFSVSHSATVCEAETELAYGNFDLIVVSGALAEGNALDFIRKLRKAENNTKILFTLAQAKSSTYFRTLIDELKVSSILPKPVSLEVLSSEYRKLLLKQDSNINALSLDAELALIVQNPEVQVSSDVHQLKNSLNALIRDPSSAEQLGLCIAQFDGLGREVCSLGFNRFGAQLHNIKSLLLQYRRQLTIFPNRIMMSKLLEASSKTESLVIEIEMAISQKKESSLKEYQYDLSRGRVCPCIVLFGHESRFVQRMASLLSADGFIVYNFADTVNALAVSDRLRPDIIIVDAEICNDGRSGFCTELSVLPWFTQNTTLVATGTKTQITKLQAKKSNINRFIDEGASNIKLLEELREYLRIDARRTPIPYQSRRIA